MKWQVAMYDDMLPQGGSILDFMSGPSRDAKTFTDLGYQVTCMDYEQGFLDIVKQDVPSARTIQGDARTVDIGEQFDGVWCNTGIFMLPHSETRQVLQTIDNHLKPGGALYINFKLLNVKEGSLERTYEDAKFGGVKRYECFFLPDLFKGLLEDQGLDVRREMVAYAQNVAYRTHPIMDLFCLKNKE